MVMLAILVLTLVVRVYRIDQPRHMYFDELYYASTATEFLQDWRYGIKTEIFEYTHPHMSKYVQAMSLWTFGNDRVTDTGHVLADVRDVAFDPAFYDSATGRYGGDLIAVATGLSLRIAPHGDWAFAVDVTVPGAARVAFDRDTHRLYVAADDGSLWAVDAPALAGVGAGGAAPLATRVGQLGGAGGQARRPRARPGRGRCGQRGSHARERGEWADPLHDLAARSDRP